ncbi:hypothetical protein E2562_022332 [Oryza meyeriana var. granulata]|uniref:Uncharacterized protein n=1 Tax=Oryza meyeriana var. granulata TaxID=110450 RepID=A0A6G1D6D3_9ORYZ|nr:hypothetical protein E2562_022332 [Oryza meyeriana var. granulata]
MAARPSSPTAEAAPHVLSTRKYVSSLEQMEAFVASGRSGFTLFVDHETSLAEASRIKRRTGPPSDNGVSVGNPELLERKKDAELGV